jgi:transcriptional regulator with XRE-family HTH domain
MGSTLEEKLKSLPAARRRKIEARAKELLAEEASLQDLRKAMGKTQVELAKALDVGQDAISRVEKRADMLLSTLSEHVRGLGGELTLVAKFPNRAPVRLTGLGGLAPEKKAPAKKRTAARRKKRAA